MRKRVLPDIPTKVECQHCWQMVGTMRGRMVLHSQFELGPQCPTSGERVTPEALEATANVARMDLVLHWAFRLRDEDPRHVASWMAGLDRAELERVLATALAAISPDQTRDSAFGWVRECS